MKRSRHHEPRPAASATDASIAPAGSGAATSSQLLDDYLTREELAAELGKCVRTLDRWHAMRLGPPRVTLGRLPMYKRTSVAAWIEKQERDPAAEPAAPRRRRRA